MKSPNEEINSEFLKRVPISVRNFFEYAGVTTYTRLSHHREDRIARLHGVGPSYLSVMKTALKERGLSFASDEAKELDASGDYELAELLYNGYRINRELLSARKLLEWHLEEKLKNDDRINKVMRDVAARAEQHTKTLKSR